MSAAELPDTTPGLRSSRYRNFLIKYWWIIAAACLLLIALPFFTPASYFLWGLGSARQFFEDQLGLGHSFATVSAVVFMFLYTIALPYAIGWLVLGRSRAKLIPAFLAILFVFGSKPLLKGLLGSSFNAKTGAAQKCYSWRGNGIVLTERGPSGCEVDPVSGQRTFEITPDVAAILARQQRPPQRIAVNDTPPQFFDPTSGRPLVWYDQTANDSVELYDSDGFSPTTGNRLRPADLFLSTTINMALDRVRREAVRNDKALGEERSPPQYSATEQYLSHPVNLDLNGDNWVALRSEPLFRGVRLAKLGPEARFRVVGQESGWSKVQLPGGQIGWILSKYVSD